MAKRQFKSESKRLLELMINSIYTHKEIFLRELISNASDAIDKLYYLSLSDENISFDKDNFFIRIETDSEKRTITLIDTGIGMSEEELNENLGTIAKSGSLNFKKTNELRDEIDIIGQFGVGFYSAFMVADKVTVETKKFGCDEAFMWESKGADGYTVLPCEKAESGTTITLYLKQSTEDENYDEFLDEYRIRGLVKKYSDYIRYPIKMLVTKSRQKAENDKEFEEYKEDETLNSMVPIWKKQKTELKDEDYNSFYKEKFYDFEEPLATIHTSADGMVSYKALLFVPKRVPFDYYTKDFEKGLQLYSNGVMIMEKCAELLPDYFGFVKGLVDSSDLSLNISREILQHDRQLKLIATHLKKKIKSELLAMQKSDREKYDTFFKNFGRQIKFGVYNEFGKDKEFLSELLMFVSSKEQKFVTLSEYVERMPEEQKYIYYASGESVERVSRLPQTEMVLDKGYEILYLTEDVDEFTVQMLGRFMEKEFKSVSSGDIGIEDEKKQQDESENKELFAFMKEALGDKVKRVCASSRLKSHAVCLTTDGALSIEMEKILNSLPNESKVKAEKVLEINAESDVFKKINNLFENDKEKLKKYTELLYGAALLATGIMVEDPIDFADKICDLID